MIKTYLNSADAAHRELRGDAIYAGIVVAVIFFVWTV